MSAHRPTSRCDSDSILLFYLWRLLRYLQLHSLLGLQQHLLLFLFQIRIIVDWRRGEALHPPLPGRHGLRREVCVLRRVLPDVAHVRGQMRLHVGLGAVLAAEAPGLVGAQMRQEGTGVGELAPHLVKVLLGEEAQQRGRGHVDDVVHVELVVVHQSLARVAAGGAATATTRSRSLETRLRLRRWLQLILPAGQLSRGHLRQHVKEVAGAAAEDGAAGRILACHGGGFARLEKKEANVSKRMVGR